MNKFKTEILQCVPGLRRYAHALCRSAIRIDADDLVQDCLMQALRRFDQWQKDSSLRAWLFAIMHNQFINELRKLKRESKGYFVKTMDNYTVDAEHKQEMDEIEKALNQLAPDQKSIILLVTLEGLSYREIAHSLQVPEGTVMSRLSRARKRLRELLDGNNESNVRYLK